MIHVYFAHCLSAPTREEMLANIEAAGRLMTEVIDRLPIVPYASWMTFARYWDESKREKGLAIDRLQISRCDEVWHTGPRLSSGMADESEYAFEFNKPIHNVIGMDVDRIVKWWRHERSTTFDESAGRRVP